MDVLYVVVVMFCEADMVPCTLTRRVVLKGEMMRCINSDQLIVSQE